MSVIPWQVLWSISSRIFFYRYCDRKSNPWPLPHTINVTFCLFLWFEDITTRPYTRECMDYLQFNPSFHCSGSAAFFPLCWRRKWEPHILSRRVKGDVVAVISTTAGLPVISFFCSCWKMSRRSRECPKARKTINHTMPIGDKRYSRPPRCLLHIQQNLAWWFLRLDSVKCEVSFFSEFLASLNGWIELLSTLYSDGCLALLGQQLTDVKVDKGMIAWGLEDLEIAAQEAVTREGDSDDEYTESTDSESESLED